MFIKTVDIALNVHALLEWRTQTRFKTTARGRHILL